MLSEAQTKIMALVDEVAAEKLRLMKLGDASIKAETVEFVQKITGISDADSLEAFKKDPMVWIVAIVLYLDGTV